MGQPIELVVGLGNPGADYARTRHNAGFWLVDTLAGDTGFRFDKKLEGEVAEVVIAGERVRLLKPLTYMNESGRAIARTLSYFKIPPDRMLVAYDEIDLPLGKAKLRFGGGHAGHNGVRNIIDHAGPGFWRIRLGVGHPGRAERVVGHVLRRPSEQDETAIRDTIDRAVAAIETLIARGPERAQNELHTAPAQSEPDATDDEPR